MTSIKENMDVSQLAEDASEHLRVSIAPNPLGNTTRILYKLPADGQVLRQVFFIITALR